MTIDFPVLSSVCNELYLTIAAFFLQISYKSMFLTGLVLIFALVSIERGPGQDKDNLSRGHAEDRESCTRGKTC